MHFKDKYTKLTAFAVTGRYQKLANDVSDDLRNRQNSLCDTLKYKCQIGGTWNIFSETARSECVALPSPLLGSNLYLNAFRCRSRFERFVILCFVGTLATLYLQPTILYFYYYLHTYFSLQISMRCFFPTANCGFPLKQIPRL